MTTGEQGHDWNSDKLKSGGGFVAEKSQTYTLDRAEGSSVKYDLVSKIAEGAKLTRRSVARILDGIKPYTFAMFKINPEEFITKAIRLINEEKATMLVEQITYSRTESTYDSTIFTAEKIRIFPKHIEPRKMYRIMFLRTEVLRRALNIGLQKIWILRKRYVCMPSCREDSRYLLRLEIMHRTGQLPSTMAL